MIPAVDIRHDLNGLATRLGLYGRDKLAATVRALNRTGTTARADGAREFARELAGLKIGAIKKRIKLMRATRNELRVVLSFSNKRLRLFNWRLGQVRTPYGTGIRLATRMPKQVLRVDAISGRARPVSASDLRSAFVQRSRRFGTPNIWLRQGRYSMPIDVLVSPSLSEILVDKRLNDVLARRARQRFSETFLQEAKFRLSKRV